MAAALQRGSGATMSSSAGDPVVDQHLEDEPAELVVHVPCGRIRGPVTAYWLRPRRVLLQLCYCEPERERWPEVDVSSVNDLCVLCARGLAGGITRWAWLACTTCRSVLRASADPQVALLPVGRHSFMNNSSVQVFASRRNVQVQQSALLQGFNTQFQLDRWCKLQAADLAAQHFPGAVSVPLTEWQSLLPPETEASRDAAARFIPWARTQDA
jgi:hypothetical protein